MITATEFRTPEEAALQLELLLLGTLLDGGPGDGPIAVASLADERRVRALRRTVERLHELAASGEESVGVVGGVSAARRAQTSASIAVLLAAKHPTTLLDVDLRAALLSFDSRAYAQEGVVDVVRYGVRSPRVVAPTAVPGLSLLPVGSGTVDLAGTWAADSFEPLLRELSRSGDLLVVNGPGVEDLDDAAPLIDRVAHWILVHEIGVTDAETTRRIRDFVGADRLLGILVLHPGHVAAAATGVPGVGSVATERDVAIEPERGALQPEPIAAPARESWERDVIDEPEGMSEGNSEPATEREPRSDTGTAAPAKRQFVLYAIAAAAFALAVFLAPRLLNRPAPAPVETTPLASIPATTGEIATPEATAEPTVDATTTEATATDAASTDATATDAAPTGEAVQGTAPIREPASASTPGREVSPPPAAATPPPAAIPPANAGGSFAVHLSSVHTSEKAQEELARWRAAGLTVFERRVDLGEKGIWHRVFAGPFADRAAADAAAASIRSRGLSDYAMVQRVATQ